MAAICNCGHSYEVHKNAEKGVLKQHEPLTKEMICENALQLVNDTDDWTENGFRVVDVLSALEGLKNIRYYYVEDSAVCGVCGETGFIFTFVEGENPIVSYTCPKCHVDKWFPFANSNCFKDCMPVNSVFPEHLNRSEKDVGGSEQTSTYTQAQLIEKWSEILETAKNGDPKYSFELFAGLMKGVLKKQQ
jgi:hypothetical protein